MKNNQEKLLVSFSVEQDFLHFSHNLPKKAQKRLKFYDKWHSLALFKEDFDLLKDRILGEANEVETKVHVENNVTYNLHDMTLSGQVYPWGVAAIKAPQTWAITEGQGVKVGIIDTGIYALHPDLQGNVTGGVNTVNKTSPLIDPNGHGTHVAGVIAAKENTVGVVGVAPKAQLYSLKAFQADGTASLIDVSEAIDWAINQNIRVLNMSFGSTTASTALHRAIQAAYSHGIIMVASAGNDGKPLEYPAAHPEVLAVGAVGVDRQVPSFSNYGKTLDFIAPGEDILSTWPVTPFYNTLSGTSMAAPHITGICALILAKNPELTPTSMTALLNQSTVKLPNISPLKQGKGAVLATKALRKLSLQTEVKTNPEPLSEAKETGL